MNFISNCKLVILVAKVDWVVTINVGTIEIPTLKSFYCLCMTKMEITNNDYISNSIHYILLCPLYSCNKIICLKEFLPIRETKWRKKLVQDNPTHHFTSTPGTSVDRSSSRIPTLKVGHELILHFPLHRDLGYI